MAFKDTEASLIGVARLAKLIYQGRDVSELSQQLINRGIQGNPAALLDLSVLLQLTGQPETGLDIQRQALSIQQHFTLEPTTDRHDIRLLTLVGPGTLMSNCPLEFVAEGAGFTLELLYVSPELPLPDRFPDHDIAIVALGELETNQASLIYVNSLLGCLPGPILNSPLKISQLSRDTISAQLQDIPGADVPLTAKVSREKLKALAENSLSLEALLGDGTFPIIIRPTDSHAGYGLEKLSHGAELTDYLARYDNPQFFISRYVEYAAPDNLYRKYRVVLIDGEPELAHMGISSHWINHYDNVGMGDSAEKREEEAREMAAFKDSFASRHKTALKNIHERVGLEYYAMDCSETQDGRLLIFEIDSSMIIHQLDSPDLYPYKQPQMQMIFDKIAAMLISKKRNSLSKPETQSERRA